MNAKRFLRGPLMWLVLVVLGFVVVSNLLSAGAGFERVDSSQMFDALDEGNIRSAKVIGSDQHEVQLTLDDGERIQAQYVDGQGPEIIERLRTLESEGQLDEGFDVDNPQPSVWSSLLFTLIPFILLAALILFFLNQAQGGGSRVMQFGKSRAKLLTKDTPKTTFSDVAGCNEAIEELTEIKEFLSEPAKFQAVGA